MKAVLCKQYGPPDSLVIEEISSPTAGPGEVVVSVKAASVNFPDLLIIQNKYQVKPALPVDELAVHFDVVAFCRLGAEVGAGLTVDGHAAGRDYFIAMPPRTEAGRGEETIQAHGRKSVEGLKR